ncbi:DUF397 domain-containing protein [Streptomyces sp. NPDC059398]|uniref:DUF397 domain-containing protein n=1 Tax=Streptomyces sp. NPDC059398 TaxID=3346820 RepID=UPI0036854FFF
MKSSYSAGSADCVEVARNVPGAVAVRDSKDPASPLIRVRPAAWDAFRVHLVGGSNP